MQFRACLIAFAFASALPAWAAEKPTAEGIEFFEKKVRPVLAEHCYECHGAKKQTASLRLDTKATLFKGGESGAVLVPGDPDKSLLVTAVRRTGDMKMPPKKALPKEAVEALSTWVRVGAPYPDDVVAVRDPAKTHWAFQPVRPVAPPATKAVYDSPIDSFIAAPLEAKGRSLAPEADRRTLIRRLSYDLTGLPPTFEEIEAFATDARPDAYRRLVDRLLDSPHYGEHQARHWMDLARYSDTKGYVFEEDRNYPYAYTYRDWLIQSFNADMPYDQFVRYQLAADRIVKDDKANLAAMGFLTVGRRFLNNPHDIIDDRLDVVFRTFQGMTIGCARCHDHKYDPIPMKEYYGLYGVFASSQEPRDLPLIETSKDTPEVRAFEAELKKKESASKEYVDKLKADYGAKLRKPETIAAYLNAVRDLKAMKGDRLPPFAAERKLTASVLESWQRYVAGRGAEDPIFRPFLGFGSLSDAEFAAKAEAQWKEVTRLKLHPAVAKAFARPPASFDEVCKLYGQLLSQPADDQALAAVLGSGGPLDLNDRQYRRVFTVPEQQKARALQREADAWKAKSPAAPARAMVMTDGSLTQPVVFLRGNPNNPGPRVPRQFLGALSGPNARPFADGSGRREMADAIASPNNPLTARVMVNRVWGHLFGQALVRTPSDFGTRADPPTHPELLDWLAARFVAEGWSVKQLHRQIVLSRAYRQTSAVAAGDDPENRLIARMARKRLTFEGLRDRLLFAAGQLDSTVGGRSTDLFKEPFSTRRAVYGFIDRQNLPGTLRSFDFALPDTHSPQRFVTTVPQQALFLMNSPFVSGRTKAIAERTASQDTAGRVDALYQRVLGRRPTEAETREAVAYAAGSAEKDSWEQLAHILVLSNEFAFVD